MSLREGQSIWFSEILPVKLNDSKCSIFSNKCSCIVYQSDISNALKISYSINLNNDLGFEAYSNEGIIPNVHEITFQFLVVTKLR